MDLDRFFTRINPILIGMLRLPVLHHLCSSGLLLLTITGRRTGKRYTIPVGYQPYGDAIVVLVSKAKRKNWWRNFRTPRPIEVLWKGRNYTAVAEVIAPDSAAFAAMTERTFRKLPFLGRQFGIEFDRSKGLTADQVAHLGREAAAVMLDELRPCVAGRSDQTV